MAPWQPLLSSTTTFTKVDGYRMIVIKCLPNLIKLDNFPVTPEEKTISKNFQFSLLGDEENYRT